MVRRSRREQIETTDIADYEVTTPDIKDLQVTTVKIADAAVVTAKVADKAIITAKGSPSFVTTALVADRAITDVKQDWLTQTGSKASGVYWVYPKAYAAAPIPTGLAPATKFDQALYPIYTLNVVAGSCIPYGSPGAYIYAGVCGKVT